MKQLTDIIQEYIIDRMNIAFTVDSVDGVVLSVCSTKWVRVGSVVLDSEGTEFTVVDFVKDESITLNATGFVGNGLAKKPVFLHGLPKSTNIDYIQLSKDSNKKLPLIWLLENYEEDFKGEESSVERSVTCRLFFVDWYDGQKWNNTDVQIKTQSPMYALASQFVQTIIDDDSTFEPLTNYKLIPRPRFGSEGDQSARVLSDDLSGVELSISFDVNRVDDDCCTKAAVYPVCLPSHIVNSDGSFDISVGAGVTYTLPDIQVAVYLNGDLVDFREFPVYS